MKKKRFISIVVLVVFLFSLTPAAAASQFTDIQGHWAKQQIEAWLNKGLASGYQDGTFRPNNPVTRAEFAAFVNRAFSTPSTGDKGKFSDLPETAWFYADVSKAVSAGIMGGYPDNTFRPNNPITRQEAASVLTRLLGLTVGDGGVLLQMQGQLHPGLKMLLMLSPLQALWAATRTEHSAP